MKQKDQKASFQTSQKMNEKGDYLCPSFSVICVELETSSLAATSGATSTTTPQVTDWTEDTSTDQDIWLY